MVRNQSLERTHMHLRISVLILIFLGISAEIYAQIIPPDFVCVKDDTLFWNAAVNACGPFVSFDIYKSSDRDGPYSLLSSVTDPNATWFVDQDQNTSFYYLESNHNCSGQNVISSDTLNNQFQQLVTSIERVSVSGSAVEISWYDNGSSQTIGYIVYRITPQGTLPIDTVFSGLSYTDLNASPEDRVESYYVLGMNACGGTNTFDTVAHSTILLTTEMSFCEQHIKLTWNGYETWANGTDNNQIWLGIDGSPLAFEHQISANDTLAYITGVIDDSEYCISILAEENGRSVTSASNVVCVVSDVLAPIEQIRISNASVDASDQVVIDWEMNSNADILDLQLHRGDDPTSFTMQQAINLPLDMDINQSIDAAAMVQQQAYYYQLAAKDGCDSMEVSNYISTVHLRLLSAQEGENDIAWSTWEATGRTLDIYEVCRLNNGVETSLGSTMPDQRFITDMIPVDARDEIACYVVKAHHTNTSGGDPRIARSNVICVEQNIEIYIPNAFVPEGTNNIFIPQFLNRPQSGYQFSVFNRWGNKVFETNDPDLGWDGSRQGDRCQSGVYMYLIHFPQPDGGVEIVSGDVTLIR